MTDNTQDNENDAMACERHDLETLPSGYDVCPLCNRERRLEAERMHRATRDPTLEPW